MQQQPVEGILICHWNGRFGNRMHQYAYGAEYSRKFGIDFLLPSHWEGTRIFKHRKHKVLDDDELRLYLNQSQSAFDNLHARSEAMQRFNARTGSRFEYLNPDDPTQNWAGKRAVFIDSVCAYHRTIFANMSKERLKSEAFAFNEDVKNTAFYRKLEDRQQTYDAAHLRRGDVSNPVYNRTNVQGYSVISKDSYLKAFKKYGFDPAEIEWVSDDYQKQWHKGREDTLRGGWTYPVGSEYLGQDLIFDWLPDFLKLYFARTIFRANSYFSWWAGLLSPGAKVYSPVIDKQLIYGRDGMAEVDYEFVEGNHPHWMYGNDAIYFEEDLRH